MAIAEHEPITGVWGQSPQRGPGAEPLVRRSGGRRPPEAESILVTGCPTEPTNLVPFQKCAFELRYFVTRNKVLRKTVCVVTVHWCQSWGEQTAWCPQGLCPPGLPRLRRLCNTVGTAPTLCAPMS